MGKQKTMHLSITSNQVDKYVSLPGSVERAALIVRHFDNPVEIAHKREFLVYIGTLEGMPATVTNAGIGGPSAYIAIEELHFYGTHTMMQVGSIAPTSQEVKIGDVVMPNGAMRMEGAGDHYPPLEFPVVSDSEMLEALETAALKLGYQYNVGITITKDSYHTEAESGTRSVYEELKYKRDSYVEGGATSISMECAVLFLIGASLGIRASGVMISAINLGEYSNDTADYPDRWGQRVIEVGIEAMRQTILQDKGRGITM